MKKLILLLPIMLFSKVVDLKYLINHSKNSGLNMSAKYEVDAANAQLNAINGSYYPTIDIGASFTKISPRATMQGGKQKVAYIKAKYLLFDSGKRAYNKKAQEYNLLNAKLKQIATYKSIELKIVNSYYNLLKLQSMLSALKSEKREILAQIDRIKKFKSAGLVTEDDLYKLQSVKEAINFKISNLKLSIKRLKSNLELESSTKFSAIKPIFLKQKRVAFKPNENIKIVTNSANAIEAKAKAILANKMPQITIEDTLSASKVSDINTPVPLFSKSESINQNKLSINLNIHIFDKSIDAQSEALKYKKLSLLSKRGYYLKQQKIEFKLSKEKLKNMLTKLKSAKSELAFAKKNYATIKEKYKSGLVDNITYLDALNQKILATAKYKESIWDLEIAKALYYYYSGREIKEFIKWKS